MNKELINAVRPKLAAVNDCLMIVNIAINGFVLYKFIKAKICKKNNKNNEDAEEQTTV